MSGLGLVDAALLGFACSSSAILADAAITFAVRWLRRRRNARDRTMQDIERGTDGRAR